MRMGIVAGQFEIFIAETENILHSRIDMHLRYSAGLAGQLQTDLFDMIQVYVGIIRVSKA